MGTPALALVALGLAAAPSPAGGPAPAEDQKPRRANRLASEKSPYLLQHAHNPVDWFPWGEEAFRKARAEEKPIFLSIGYFTCHWCHVMERESFENEEIARILNESFVSIKVDREERPDVDDVYMSAVQTLTGHGGWPLSAFLTPDGKPFFGGTYFPPEDDPARGRGFRSLLLQVKKVWAERRSELVASADGAVAHLKTVLALPLPGAEPAGGDPASPSRAALTPELLQRAFEAYRKTYDPEQGGFGGAPKFPRTAALDFLLAYSVRTGSAEARSMALTTLDRMAQGGIRDHLAGGFHRYSTDREWTVPHFEKMLYDQALIARTYLDAGRLTGEKKYLDVGRETLDYVLQRLSHPEGGLHTGEDADSEGAEGKYYVWSRSEIISVLGREDGELFADYHQVTEGGNFEDSGRSVLTARMAPFELGRKAGLEPAALDARLASCRRRLLLAREGRVPPAKDDKVLTDWNGLGISALSVAYQATGEPRYLSAAERAADFIGKRLQREGRLLHRFRDGAAGVPGFLEDHAFLAAGLLDLYEAGFDPERLREALRLVREMLRLFWDETTGGFFQTGPDHEALILRRKEFYDGAIPSGNAVAYLCVLRLLELTEDPALREKVKVMDRIAAALLRESPTEHPQLLLGAAYRLAPPRQIAVVAAAGDEAAREMVAEIHRRYLPAKVLTRVAPEDLPRIVKLIPLLEGKTALDQKATAYVCRGGTCKLPAPDLATLRRQLSES